MSPPSSKLAILSHLHEYAAIHDKGNDEIKSSFWNLQKARRAKSRGGSLPLDSAKFFLPQDVREELRAQKTLLLPSFDGENSNKFFELFDAAKRDKQQHSNNENNVDSSSSGLRQRKKVQENEQLLSPTTTTKTSNNNTMIQQEADEDLKLRQMDPINLFGGITPAELKKAQSQAKQALEMYVQAANHAAAILDALNHKKH